MKTALLTVFAVAAAMTASRQVRLASVTASGDECTRTAHMRIYSNASFIEETGDVVGYELALDQRNDSTVEARLYLYEGAPNHEGIPISGQISGKKLTLEGNWVEHLIEYPSKKEIAKTHFVRIDGTLDPVWFRGAIKIEGLDTPTSVRLRRVDRIWMCKRHERP
jgi:hypothetical protein